MQISRQAEFRVDGGPADCFGARVLNVCVAGSAYTDGHELVSVIVKDVCESWHQQGVSGLLRHSGELRLHRFQNAVRVIVAHYDRVAGQSVPARMAARDEAGDVDSSHRRKDRVVSRKGDPTGGKLGEIRREVGPDLRRLESVECGYEDAGHWRKFPFC